MFYRIFLLLVFNLLISQSFFNHVVGDEIGFQSARSHAMGHTHFMNSNTSALTLRNPSKLALLDIDSFQLDFNLSNFSYHERRSIDLKDFFGDFLTEGDYVSNLNSKGYTHFGGIVPSKISPDYNFIIAYSYGPWSSLDYRYEEEVRGSISFDDGVVGTRDILEGYHILEHSGVIYMQSLAIAIGMPSTFSIGLGFNQLKSGSYAYRMEATEVADSFDNLASVLNIDGNIDYEGETFRSVSMTGVFDKIEISLGVEDNAFIKSSDDFENNFDITMGLPFYSQMNINSDLEYVSMGIRIEKPKKHKLGINLKDGFGYNYRLLSFEIIDNIFSDNMYQDFKKINLGLEYAREGRSLRLGLSYKEPVFQTLSPLTLFCFGISEKMDRTTFDVAASYSYQKYQYKDLFSVQDDVRPDYDNVHESNWSVVSTISHNF